METKFTKGDWENRKGRIFVKGTYNSIATVERQKEFIHTEEPDYELEANAKLIAAAPDMFEALRVLMQNYDSKGHLLNFDVNIARQAIRKAAD